MTTLNYASFCYVDDLPELAAATALKVREMQALGNIAGADRLVRAAVTLKRELELHANSVAIKATEILVATERRERVRPDSLGGGGPRLEEYLRADPIILIPGSVGVANKEVLDAHVPWWVTNELGSDKRLGSKTRLYGYYDEPGQAIPAQAFSREHALFVPENSYGGAGGWMTIKRPIPARRFVEKSLPSIFTLWRAGFEIINKRFLAQIDTAIAEGLVI